MAIIVVMDAPGGTQAQYEQICNKLTNGRGLVHSPHDWPVAGLRAHVAGPTGDGWFVADVWDSIEDFHRFAEILAPYLREVGFPDVEPRVLSSFNLVTA
ncbi:hypothetical protein GCM10020367_65200 [Streptomyces sannanensis]|uniref:ABM domain-containing protein n=1 Tax=Streptomyces sannanensis TaxID=285536 RepID=A0ABP6S4R3_9ACTN